MSESSSESQESPTVGEIENPDYNEYKQEISEKIQTTLEEMRTQPVLFFGTGISRRYFDAPNWENLLKIMIQMCPRLDNDPGFYLQGSNEYEVASRIVDDYQTWAWNQGRDQFPEQFFRGDVDEDIYLKYSIARYLRAKTPDHRSEAKSEYIGEINALQNILPQAVITTNYDTFLETLFDDHDVRVGSEVLTSDFTHPSQILKIHGSTTDPESLVLTKDDYEDFKQNKKYLSAKLLTYLAEHPVLIAGYSARDPNIRQILSDLDQVLSPVNGYADNIYLLTRGNPGDVRSFERRKHIPLGDGRTIEVNLIKANSWEWVFEAFGEKTLIGQTHYKLLNQLFDNVYNMVVNKAPREEVEINYQALERKLDDEKETPTLMGISPPGEDASMNPVLNHPYRPTDLARDELDLPHPAALNSLIDELAKETRIDIRKSNNQYHVAFFPRSNEPRMYSSEAKELLEKYRNGDEFQIDMSPAKLEESRANPNEYT